MTLEELRARQRELQATMADLANDATRAEEFGRMEREFRANEREINMMIQERQIAATTPAEQRNPDAMLREVLIGARNGTHSRELTLATEVTKSGAVELNIHDLIDTVTPSTKLPKSLQIVHGVTGNDLYPVSINDLTMEEIGENVKAKDQKLDFDKITVTPHRATLNILISNAAIDNMAYPLMALVQNKFKKAEATYIAEKALSQAAFTGNKGAFSNLAPVGVITLGSGDEYKQILTAVAEFSNKGFFEGEVCLSMDRVTEAQLMATPKIKGAAGGFVIENGRCAGYRYTVSHFVNSELNASGKLVAGSGRYLEIGYYEWFAAQQHNVPRLTIDATSTSVAKRNITAITINTAFSLTDLSVFINGAGGTTQAFACYAVMDANTPQVLASQHAVVVAKNGSKTSFCCVFGYGTATQATADAADRYVPVCFRIE